MRKYIIRFFAFLALFFVIDRAAGFVLNYIAENPRGGMTLRRNYINDHCHEDVLVFGSSRAHYHYNPKVVTDSLGLSCYNCGENANGIILFYAWWKMITQRYYPKLLIYDVHSLYDVLEGDNYSFLQILKRFSGKDCVKPIINDVDPNEHWKLHCMMYRYNSTFTELAADFISPVKDDTSDGFIPLQGHVNTKHVKGKPAHSDHELKFDSLKHCYLEKLIKERGTTQLVFVVSPMFEGMNPAVFEPVEKLCRQYGIIFLNYVNDSKYKGNIDYFKDLTHLNAEGADVYTRQLMKDLKPLLKGDDEKQ